MQFSKSFDQDTIIKILKGGAIAASGAFGLYVLNALGQIEINNPLLVSFFAWIIPVATNAIREWMKGE